MALIPTPAASSTSKSFPGVSDVDINTNGTIKVLGCSLINVNMNTGFSGSSSSLSLELVEDLDNGDLFTDPAVPSVVGFSLPKGGVDQPVLWDSATLSALSKTKDEILEPSTPYDSDVPFYLSGIISGIDKTLRSTAGRTISVLISDPREILRGCQCLLGGFALSQELSSINGRYDNATNVIDCFGYYDYGMTSGRNKYGMTWASIKQALEASKATLYNIDFEFSFTGSGFSSIPDWYRVQDEVIDIVGLVEKVANDCGSVVTCVGRKVNASKILVEFRADKRTSTNRLTETEINTFIAARDSIISSVTTTKEFRNEPTSGIIIGGQTNTNYVCYPTIYDESLHLDDDIEDYTLWPSNIEDRLFIEDETGSIFPFWGTSPFDNNEPLITPFLSLDHLAGSPINLPWIQIETVNKEVRTVSHSRVFLDGDEDSDTRPFSRVAGFSLDENKPSGDGWIYGLPLNTEVLKASLIDPRLFYMTYALYYPTVARHLGMAEIDWKLLRKHIETNTFKNHNINDYFTRTADLENVLRPTDLADMTFSAMATFLEQSKRSYILSQQLYYMVHDYAKGYMGSKFLACLPRSEIMNRIWNGDAVPTDVKRPIIEYSIADAAYWDVLPSELNPDDSSHDTNDSLAAESIKEKFEQEDGRFTAMAFMDRYPKGNASFYANGKTEALFVSQEVGLSPSDFRPNRVADQPYRYVAIQCSVAQMTRRPDLAIVELPSAVAFNPTNGYKGDAGDDVELITVAGFIDAIKQAGAKDPGGDAAWIYANIDENQVVIQALLSNTTTYDNKRQLSLRGHGFYTNLEMVMDLKGITIPLVSNWTRYGPWYQATGVASGDDGMQEIIVDESLVPWNFERPIPPADPFTNLDAAGLERLNATVTNLVSVNAAKITAAGFPEIGPLSRAALTSNQENHVTGISCSFSSSGVTTIYDLSTYKRVPGTYRKTEIQKTAEARVKTRDKLETVNIFTGFAANPYSGYHGSRLY